MQDFQQEIDTRNEHCPAPVMKTKNALRSMQPGDVLHVVSTDPTSVEDITHLLDALKDELVESSQQDGEFHFYIKKA